MVARCASDNRTFEQWHWATSPSAQHSNSEPHRGQIFRINYLNTLYNLLFRSTKIQKITIFVLESSSSNKFLNLVNWRNKILKSIFKNNHIAFIKLFIPTNNLKFFIMQHTSSIYKIPLYNTNLQNLLAFKATISKKQRH